MNSIQTLPHLKQDDENKPKPEELDLIETILDDDDAGDNIVIPNTPSPDVPETPSPDKK